MWDLENLTSPSSCQEKDNGDICRERRLGTRVFAAQKQPLIDCFLRDEEDEAIACNFSFGGSLLTSGLWA